MENMYDFVGQDRPATIWALLMQMQYSVMKAGEKALSKVGISLQEYSVLWVLGNHAGPPTQAEVARWLSRENHSVSGLLTRMEDRGLLTRTQDENNLRLLRIRMTPKGEQVYTRATAVHGQYVGKLLSGFADTELAHFENGIRLLRKAALKRLGMKSVQLRLTDLASETPEKSAEEPEAEEEWAEPVAAAG